MPLSKVFLSHSSLDKTFVDRLAADLEKVNVGVWYDKWEIKVGDSLIDKIAEGIESNDYLVAVLSNHSVGSDWVKKELNAALMRELAEKKVIVLPLVLDGCKIPTLLAEKKYANFRISYETGFEELLVVLSDESLPATLRKRDFRTTQYLLAGLANTDDCGTNILKASQFERVYPFRKELRNYTGPEEKRLLFWSSVAFKQSNSNTPIFLGATTPTWGLTDDASDTQRATWVMEGLRGVLFDSLLPYYDWATTIVQPIETEELKTAILYRQLGSTNTFGSTTLSSETQVLFLSLLAKADPAFFHETTLPSLDDNLENPTTPFLIEATSHLSAPLDDSFYFRLIGTNNKNALGGLKALAHLKRPSAVEFLKAFVASEKSPETEELDTGFNCLNHPDFKQSLISWLAEKPKIDVTVRILAILTNLNADVQESAMATFEPVLASSKRFELLPVLLRVLGRVRGDNSNMLQKYLMPSQPITTEAAVYSIARQMKLGAISILQPLLATTSETVLASTIEAIAKILGDDAFDILKPFTSHPSDYVRSSLYWSLRYFRNSNWLAFRLMGLGDHNPLVRICAARSYLFHVDQEIIQRELTRTDLDGAVRATFDEILYAKAPFIPEWISEPSTFNAEVARYTARLTNFDADTIFLHAHLDLNRSIGVLVGRDKGLPN